MTRLVILLLLAWMISACGSDSTPTPQPQPTETEQPEATETIEATIEPTIEATAEISANSEGQRLFTQFFDEVGFACSTCHYPTSNDRLLGPGLLGIEERFETYELEAESLEAYIRESILDPTAFIVPDASPYPPNIMPRNYADIFTDAEIDELIVFILSH